MTFRASISDDLDMAIADYPTEIKHISARNEGDETTPTAFNALRRDITKDDLTANPQLSELPGTVWNIKSSDCEREPKTNDQIYETVSKTYWTVLSVGVLTLGTRYRCVCKKNRT